MNIEGMLENEKNDTIEKIDDLAAGMTQDYKVFNAETSNMVIQQERLFIILGISSVVIVGITVYYVMNK
jgi:cobalamin biosynthesis Co2+ chelatase CbiK